VATSFPAAARCYGRAQARFLSEGGNVKPLTLGTAAIAAAAAAVLISANVSAAPTSTSAVRVSRPVPLPPAARVGETVLYGHIRSLTRKGKRFELRFDPAWWLGGVPAERAAVQDKVIRPGEPVPNDYYIVDESHRLLTYVVPATAHVTVLDIRHLPNSVSVSVDRLARLVRAGTRFGFWIRVGKRYPSPVLSLDQQYQP
jgi:hypothetical protein